MGQPALFISPLAIRLSGQRTATVFKPPVVSSGMVLFFGSIMVRGPGQNFSAKSLAFSGTLSATSESFEGSDI